MVKTNKGNITMTNKLIDFIMMDLDNMHIRRMSRAIGVSAPHFFNTKEDFYIKEYVSVVLNEFRYIKQALMNHMIYEQENGINMWDEYYFPGDVLTEGEIELNSLIANLEELLNLLE